MDPTESPRRYGTDINGMPVRLGDTDCDGVAVGYIDDGGTCWESRTERDMAIGAGRSLDAFIEYNYHGGVLGPPPDFEAIMAAESVLEENLEAAMDHLHNGIRFYRASAARRAQIATWN
jgi:hypothetical protein